MTYLSDMKTEIYHSESEILKQIIDALNLHGALVLRLNSGKAKYNMRLCPPGTPDILALLHNGALWIEVKTRSGKVSKDQEKMHEELKRRGQRVIIARSVTDVLEAIK